METESVVTLSLTSKQAKLVLKAIGTKIAKERRTYESDLRYDKFEFIEFQKAKVTDYMMLLNYLEDEINKEENNND